MKKNELVRGLTAGALVFKHGFVEQVCDESAVSIGLATGFYQGLKYNGSFKRGLKAGVITIGAIGAANGAMNVIKNWDTIVEAAKDESIELRVEPKNQF